MVHDIITRDVNSVSWAEIWEYRRNGQPLRTNWPVYWTNMFRPTAFPPGVLPHGLPVLWKGYPARKNVSSGMPRRALGNTGTPYGRDTNHVRRVSTRAWGKLRIILSPISSTALLLILTLSPSGNLLGLSIVTTLVYPHLRRADGYFLIVSPRQTF